MQDVSIIFPLYFITDISFKKCQSSSAGVASVIKHEEKRYYD